MLNSTLVDIDSGGNVFVTNKGIALAPKLFEVYKNKNMGSNMVKWIVSVEDYKSIYNRLPMAQREEEAMMNIFGNKNGYCTNKLVIEARKEYRKFDYDPLMEQYQLMVQKSHDMNEVYRNIKPNKNNLSEILKIEADMEKSAQARERMKKIIIENSKSQNKLHGREEEDLSLQEEMLRRKGDAKKHAQDED